MVKRIFFPKREFEPVGYKRLAKRVWGSSEPIHALKTESSEGQPYHAQREERWTIRITGWITR